MQVTACLMNLYLCPQRVSGPERGGTTRYGCRVVASVNGINGHDQPFDVGAKTIPRQVPRKGGAPVHGSGWWAACVQYTANIYSGMQRAGKVAPYPFRG